MLGYATNYKYKFCANHDFYGGVWVDQRPFRESNSLAEVMREEVNMLFRKVDLVPKLPKLLSHETRGNS